MWTKPIGGKKRWITHDNRTTTLHDGSQSTAVYVMWLATFARLGSKIW